MNDLRGVIMADEIVRCKLKLFKPGVKVQHKNQESVVESVWYTTGPKGYQELMVRLRGIETSIRSEELTCEPTICYYKRRSGVGRK